MKTSLHLLTLAAFQTSIAFGQTEVPPTSGSEAAADRIDGDDADTEVIRDAGAVDVDTAIAEAATTSDENATVADTIGDRIAAAEGLSKLGNAIKAADFEAELNAEGPFTFFAPTDTAFDEMSEASFKKLLLPDNKEKLSSLLAMHLVPGLVTADQMETGTVETVSGEQFMVVVDDGSITVGKASVTMADNLAGNGVFHMIDGFIETLPDSAEESGDGEPDASTVVVEPRSVTEVSIDEDVVEEAEEPIAQEGSEMEGSDTGSTTTDGPESD